ncbi:MAG: hypothetical protein ACOC93_04080 [Planctomycetota bacterium]
MRTPELRVQQQTDRHKGDGRDGTALATAAKLRACVLLSGVVRTTKLTSRLSRSLLDLPLDDNLSLLDLWRGEGAALAGEFDLGRMPLRVMVTAKSPRPMLTPAENGIRVQVETDPVEYRGTAGLLRDLAEDYEDDEFMLVVNGGQLLLRPLPELTGDLLRSEGDVRLVSHSDGTPTGILLVRCGALRAVPSVGFVDLKEQALPRIAENYRVTVMDVEGATGLPIRTRADYLGALFYHHCRPEDEAGEAFAERWQRTFCVVEEGAHVDDTARIHNSVVLRGGWIEPGATVVNSVVCQGGRVARGQTVIDRVVGRRGRANKRRDL